MLDHQFLFSRLIGHNAPLTRFSPAIICGLQENPLIYPQFLWVVMLRYGLGLLQVVEMNDEPLDAVFILLLGATFILQDDAISILPPDQD